MIKQTRRKGSSSGILSVFLSAFTKNVSGEKMFTHCRKSPLGAGPLVSGLDRQSVACSSGIQAGRELGRRAEV